MILNDQMCQERAPEPRPRIEVNPMDRHLGKDVQELSATDTIRFCGPDDRHYFEVKMQEDGSLHVRAADRRLNILPHASNVVYIEQVPW